MSDTFTPAQASDLIDTLKKIEYKLSKLDKFSSTASKEMSGVSKEMGTMKDKVTELSRVLQYGTKAEIDSYKQKLINLELDKKISKEGEKELEVSIQKTVAVKDEIRRIDQLRKQYKEGSISLKDFTDETKNSVYSLTNLGSAVDATTKAEARRVAAEISARKVAMDAFGDWQKTLGTTTKGVKAVWGIATQAGSALGGIVKNIDSGASGVTIAAGAMSAEIDLHNAAIQGVTGGISKFGVALAPATYGLSLLVSAGAEAVGALYGASTAIDKFKIDLAASQINKLVKSYNDAASAGALFAGGMDEFHEITAKTGLTMDHFSTMAKSNAAILASAGMSVGDGVRKIAKVFEAGGKGLKNHLINLGMSMEDGGDIISMVMRNIQQAGKKGLSPATNDEIAQTVKEYAENLKLLSAISGEEAKTKMKAAEDEMKDFAWQAELASMDEKETF